METVEILHYKWCLYEVKLGMYEDGIFLKTVDDRLLVYCKVEVITEFTELDRCINRSHSYTRIVPVKRSEMDTI